MLQPDDITDREAALGRLAAGLWHEVINLVAICGFWARDLGHAEAPARLDQALARLAKLVHAQQACARGALAAERESFDGRTALQLAADLTAPRFRVADLSLELSLPEAPVTLDGTPGELGLALALYLGRLAQSASGPGSLTVRLDGRRLCVSGPTIRWEDVAALTAEGDPELVLIATLTSRAGLAIVLQ